MDAIPTDLSNAVREGRERLAGFSRSAAAANAAPGSPASAKMLAAAAGQAIFTDALLAAMHARLEELKSVAK